MSIHVLPCESVHRNMILRRCDTKCCLSILLFQIYKCCTNCFCTSQLIQLLNNYFFIGLVNLINEQFAAYQVVQYISSYGWYSKLVMYFILVLVCCGVH